MPEIIVYTNEGSCSNGVAEINPFTVGDATDEWTLRFNNGTDFYSVANATMSVGHINGLPAGTYNSAFKWTDRADNVSTANIDISAAGVPTLQFQSSTDPLGGVIGTNGVYILRGPQLDGSVTSIEILDKGAGLRGINATMDLNFAGAQNGGSRAIGHMTMERDPNGNPGGSSGLSQIDHIYYNNQLSSSWSGLSGTTIIPSVPYATGSQATINTASFNGKQNNVFIFAPSGRGSNLLSDVQFEFDGSSGTGTATRTYRAMMSRGRVGAVTLTHGGSGYVEEPTVSFAIDGSTISADYIFTRSPALRARIAFPKYEFPFMRDESGNNIIAATTLSPYSDGEVEGSTQFDHSTLVIRPETVANGSSRAASTDATGPKWTATMNPINAYVTERLALRNSTQLDLQIRGDGRTLFQGQLSVLNKIA